jgi:hypothetical protein
VYARAWFVETYWRVEWWRGYHFEIDSKYAPGTMTVAPQVVIINCICGNHTERHQIRVYFVDIYLNWTNLTQN